MSDIIDTNVTNPVEGGQTDGVPATQDQATPEAQATTERKGFHPIRAINDAKAEARETKPKVMKIVDTTEKVVGTVLKIGLGAFLGIKAKEHVDEVNRAVMSAPTQDSGLTTIESGDESVQSVEGEVVDTTVF